MSDVRRRLSAPLLLWLAGLAPSVLATVQHHYVVAVDAQLRRITVTAELASGATLTARDGDAAQLRELSGCNGASVRLDGGQIIVPAAAACVRYRHALTSAGEGNWRAPRTAQDVRVTAPGQWLWLPPLTGADRVLVTLDLPAGINASVPWRPLADGRYELRASPRSSRAVAVFGNFRRQQLELPGAVLRIALVDDPRQTLNAAAVGEWLAAAASDVARVSGAFPNPAPQIIVQPSPAAWWRQARSAVPFGYVIRDGGETVRFFVDPQRPVNDLLGDWTATHEFSHLLLPYVRSADKWVSEGFASYYQNVLLARRGVYTEQEAWRRLSRSFAQAAATPDPPPLRDLGSRPFWEVRMLVYWSGAAIALLADVELRQRSEGRESLDTVLARLQDCCLPSGHVWRAERLFAKLDELSPFPVFEELYARHAIAPGMPDFQTAFTALGVVPRSGQGVPALDDAAPQAWVRRAIMTAVEQVAEVGKASASSG